MTTTILTYLINPTLFTQAATITGKGMDERGSFIITDVTPAYPQGGGQEADNGNIICEVGDIYFNDVRYFDGLVKHYIPVGWESLYEGGRIKINIDENYRKLNSILHTAGHLVASVSYKNFPHLIPTKGHHFRDGSYIELSGELLKNPDEIKAQVQQILNEEIKTEKNVSYELVTAEELTIKCPFIQPGIPTNKALRVVDIEDYFPMGCGGTHVEKLNEIPALNITKLKAGKGIVRISYNCHKL